MKKFLLVFLFFHLSSSVKHSLVFFSIGFSGIPDFPDFVGNVEVDGTEVSYCDSNKTIKPKQHWVETLMQKDPDHVNWYKGLCFTIQPFLFSEMMNSLMQAFNQSGGVHVLQRISGCEWDDETGEVEGLFKYAYDGEDIMSLDVKSLTWIALKPEVVDLKSSRNADDTRLKYDEKNLIQVFPEWLKMYLEVGRSSLLRTVLPSVSLLQKSPSSPVSCHATGFFPDRAVMFWRRDGEELQEDVDHGEILPNHDGSFQMSVDLNISSVLPEDWRRYECVFQLSGVKEDQVYKLHKDRIRSRRVKPPPTLTVDPAAVAVGVGVSVGLLIVAAVVLVLYLMMKAAQTRTEGPESTSMNTPSCSQPDQDHHNQEEEALNTEQD